MKIVSGSKQLKQKVITILTNSFQDNPSVLSVIKNDNRKKLRIKRLVTYAYNTAKRRDGIFISYDNSGAALCYKYNAKKETLFDIWDQLILAMFAIGPKKVLSVMKRDSYIKNKRPKSGEFLYFWFLGVLPEARGNGAVRELKEIIFKKANQEKLPIYLETSVTKNKKIYERYGFEVYHSWNEPGKNHTIWFMKREPDEKLILA